jgi:hypothetical protein
MQVSIEIHFKTGIRLLKRAKMLLNLAILVLNFKASIYQEKLRNFIFLQLAGILFSFN